MLPDETARRAAGRKAGFAKIPEPLQRDARLVGCDLRLLARLIHYAWSSGVCWPSVRRLAADLSLAERTVQVALKRLYGLGYVSTRPASNPTGREFLLHLDGAQPATPPSPPPAAPPPPIPVAPESDPVPSQQIQRTRAEGSPGTTERAPSPPAIASPHANPTPPPARPGPGRMTGDELAAMTRALAAAGDPAATRELARLERPRPAPAPPPSSLAELIDRLDDDPTHRPRLAAALADHWGDRKSYEFYWKVAMRAPRDAIARAFAACRSADSPPAMFTALLRRDPRFAPPGPGPGAPRRRA